MANPAQTTDLLDLSELPALRRYLNSLPHAERRAATDRLGRLSSTDLLSLGVSEPQPAEYDYRVDHIDGSIPRELCGTLYRNGPGRWQDHTGRPLHHLFDGDGMLSAFAIRDGGVHYRNRYVRTRHYRGKSGTTHLGTAAPGGWRANIAKTPPNLANTNVVEHAGHVYALWEGGAPYEVDPDTLDTVGVCRFGGALRPTNPFSAHPSFCPRSGDMFNFGVEVLPRPHLRIYRADPRGNLKHLRSARLPYLAMVHDFAITQRYLVFLVSPIVANLLQVGLGSSRSATRCNTARNAAASSSWCRATAARSGTSTRRRCFSSTSATPTTTATTSWSTRSPTTVRSC